MERGRVPQPDEVAEPGLTGELAYVFSVGAALSLVLSVLGFLHDRRTPPTAESERALDPGSPRSRPRSPSGVVGPTFQDDVYAPPHHPDSAFQRAIEQGVRPHHWDFGPMPALPHLDTDDVRAITAYVSSEQRKPGIDEGRQPGCSDIAPGHPPSNDAAAVATTRPGATNRSVDRSPCAVVPGARARHRAGAPTSAQRLKESTGHEAGGGDDGRAAPP